MTDFNPPFDPPVDPEDNSSSSTSWRIRPSLLLVAIAVALVVGILVARWIPWEPVKGRGEVQATASTNDFASEVDDLADEDQLWTCAMHPHVLQHGPGQCPICGMKLVPAGHGSTAKKTTTERSVEFYRHPMDPSITSPVPAKDSMGMDYIPVYSDDGESVTGDDIVLDIDPTVQQNMNLRTAPAVRGDLRREVRATGALDYDPESMISVTTKVPGWIEKVYVHQVGETVRRGQPLFEVYSPELIQAGEELLAARRYVLDLASADQASSPSSPPSSIEAGASDRAARMVEAARSRLSYWDVSADEIARIEASGVVPRTLTVTAPSSGTLMQRPSGLEGRAVTPGFEVLHLADLSR
ncbi:MAG: efflux RND transporter periplasmic adaptor subunit, partial [Thermoanaerobaculia bacterium]|nr:efflux RND transporter periplasmic adaptor subunit [Thermoanaerobaculia bacterium]